MCRSVLPRERVRLIRAGAPRPRPPCRRWRRPRPLPDLPLDVLSKICEGGNESRRVILGGDAVWDVVSDDVDTSPSIDRGDLPGHRHPAGERRVVGNEVDGLNDPHVRNNVDVLSLDDVGVGRGLPRSARSSSTSSRFSFP